MLMAQVIGPKFCAGLVLKDDCVVACAPILKNMRCWSRDQVREYCKKMGWTVRVILETR